MMQSIIGGETSTIVHVPGKILFTNDPNAIIKGNSVTFKENVIDVLLLKQSNNKIIKYKK